MILRILDGWSAELIPGLSCPKAAHEDNYDDEAFTRALMRAEASPVRGHSAAERAQEDLCTVQGPQRYGSWALMFPWGFDRRPLG